MTVNGIFEFLNNLFPTESACDFDNVGLLIGDGESEVTKALIALDCTKETIELAIKEKAQLIITHHPVIFEPLKSVLENSIVFKAIKNGIAVISMHTNLDVGINGVNDTLCSVLGLENITPITSADGYLLKSGEISPTSADNFAKCIKSRLGGRIKYVDGGKEITKLLVCSGSGGDFIADAENYGFDALVTADVKHHQFLEAQQNGISLFDAGHFETEDIVVEPLKEILSKAFKEIEFLTFHPQIFKYV